MPKRKLSAAKRYRGYLAKCLEGENGEAPKGHYARTVYIHARSPRDAIDILGDRLIPHGHGFAKIKITTLSSGEEIDGYGIKSRTYSLFTRRVVRYVKETTAT